MSADLEAARNESTPSNDLGKLAFSEDPAVREAVLANPNTPDWARRRIASDSRLQLDSSYKPAEEFITQAPTLPYQVFAEQYWVSKEKQSALASMLITSGFTFDGHTITKYCDYISGDHAVSMNRPTQGFWGSVRGNVGGDLLLALSEIRRHALAKLKEAAYDLGCNAVIGVDFDYLTLDPETVNNRGGTLYLPFLFAVTANGNAVIIEKNT